MTVSRCLVCGDRLDQVFVVERRGTWHGADDHQFVFTERTFARCPRGHGQLESYSHDCFSHDDDWDLYWWFVLDEPATAALSELVSSCATPHDGACTCTLHRSLRTSAERLWATRGATSPAGPLMAARIRLADGPRFVLEEPVSLVTSGPVRG